MPPGGVSRQISKKVFIVGDSHLYAKSFFLPKPRHFYFSLTFHHRLLRYCSKETLRLFPKPKKGQSQSSYLHALRDQSQSSYLLTSRDQNQSSYLHAPRDQKSKFGLLALRDPNYLTFERKGASMGTLVDIKAVAKQLGIKESMVRNLVFKKKIPFIKIGSLLRFDPDQITTWYKTNHTKNN